MRWSTYLDDEGVARAAVWEGDRLHPVPGDTSLVALITDDRLAAAADAARAEPSVDPAGVRLLAPIPRPPSIRDFMAFEEHVVTASAAIGLTVDPLWYEQPVFYFTNPASLGDRVHLEADGLGAIDAAVVPGPAVVPLRPEVSP